MVLAVLRCDSFRQTDIVQASAVDVFSLLADIEAWPTWASVIRSARPLSSGPLRVGFRFELTLKSFNRPLATELLEYTKDSVFVWGVARRLVRLRHGFELTAHGPSRCQLHHRESAWGLLAPPSWLLKRRICQINQQWSADVVGYFANRAGADNG